MASKDVSHEVPRFDSLLTAAESRRDDWQRLQALAQARASAAAAGDETAARKLAGEAGALLARLEPLETFWAFPGPARMQKLRERMREGGGDPQGCCDLARRLA